MGVSISEFYTMRISEMFEWIDVFDEGNKLYNRMVKKNT